MMEHEKGYVYKLMDKGGPTNASKKEANDFAKNLLIDEEEHQKFVKTNDFSKSSIKHFALTQSVADFIVVGRLQKDGLVDWSQYQGLKPKYEIKF